MGKGEKDSEFLGLWSLKNNEREDKNGWILLERTGQGENIFSSNICCDVKQNIQRVGNEKTKF